MQIGLFLTLLGPRNLPALSHQMDHWLSSVWETAFLCKTLVNSLFPTIALLLIFPWYFPEQSGKVILFSVIFHLIFNEPLFTSLAFWAIQSIFIRVIVIWAIQSNLYVIFISVLVHCYKTFFLLLRFLTLFNLTVARAYSLDFCRSHYRIMFSVLKYLDISCCWM